MSDLGYMQSALSAARPRAVAALLRYFRDLDLAEEAFQEACLRALRVWPENGPPRDPASWLIMVGRNAALDSVRRGARQMPLCEAPASVVHGTGSDTEAELVERLARGGLALQSFEAPVDVAVIETGLGGRLDSTNVVRPLVAGVTSIGIDHVDRLAGAGERGTRLEEEALVVGDEAPKQRVPDPTPIAPGLVRHLADIVRSGEIWLGGERAAVGELRHAVDIRHHDPVVGVDEHLHEPAVDVVRSNPAQQHEVPEDHQPLDMVAPALAEELTDDPIDRRDAGGAVVDLGAGDDFQLAVPVQILGHGDAAPGAAGSRRRPHHLQPRRRR